MWNLDCAQKLQDLRGDFWFAASLVANRPVLVIREWQETGSGGPHERIPGRIKGRIKSCSRPAQKWGERSGAIGSTYE